MTFTFHAFSNTFNLLMSMKTCNSFYSFCIHKKNYDDNWTLNQFRKKRNKKQIMSWNFNMFGMWTVTCHSYPNKKNVMKFYNCWREEFFYRTTWSEGILKLPIAISDICLTHAYPYMSQLPLGPFFLAVIKKLRTLPLYYEMGKSYLWEIFLNKMPYKPMYHISLRISTLEIRLTRHSRGFTTFSTL